MVLGIRTKSRKSVSNSIQLNYIIHVHEIKPWPPSQSLRSVQSVLLQWENGDRNSGSLPSNVGNGKIEFNEPFKLPVFMIREASKKTQNHESFKKNYLDFHLYDRTVKSQLLGSASINFADFGIIKEVKSISFQLNCKKSFRSSTQPLMYVSIQPFDVECSSSSPSSRLSKEFSLDKEESESVSHSVKDEDDDLEIASFTDDETDDIPSNNLQTIRSASETIGDNIRIGEGGTKGSNGERILPSESTTSSSYVNTKDTKAEASAQVNGIKSPSSSLVLRSGTGKAENGRPSSPKISDVSVKVADASSKIQESVQQSRWKDITTDRFKAISPSSYTSSNTKDEASTQVNDIRSPTSSPLALRSGTGNAENGRPSLPKISEGSVKVADASSKIQESTQQSRWKDITSDRFKAISSSSDTSSSMKPHFEISSQSQAIPKDISQEDSTGNSRYKEDSPEKVSSVSNNGVMEDEEKMDERVKGQRQFTMSNEFSDDDFSDDEFARTWKIKSDTLRLRKKSHKHPTIISTNDKSKDVRNEKSPIQTTQSNGKLIRSQYQDPKEKINPLNGVHVDAACHKDINANGNFPNDNTELKAEVEMLREELREAAALEASMYSVIAEHGSTNKVHAPARRLSRFYFHDRRAGSPAKIASAAQSVISGFVLVSKACGNDVPRLTFWFSNLILLRAIVSKGDENKDLGDGPCINSECYVNGHALQEQEKENSETFIVALEKVEAWIFSRIVESVWWQTLTPYMQSAAAKSSNSRKTNGKRYVIGDQDQGNFSVDLWKRAFKDACERLCPLRAGGLECGCLPVISRMVMEQLVNRLDVAMFNAILRESADEMPTDPVSDPISDSKVLPIPSGKSGFGAGAQLKNSIGDWSRWLSNLFGIDDSDSHDDDNENDDSKYESPFKPFPLLNALSDLMMLPFDMLADSSMRKEVCPRFGISLIKQVVNNFVPDEFSPGPVPNAVFEALNNEDIEDDEGSITSFPCTAGSTFYAPPAASSVVSMLKEGGTPSLRSGSFVLKKLYTSDDELDELDTPLSALGMDDTKKKYAVVKGGRKVVRYELLREVWKSSGE
ncbi:EEIG1/EHBP1 protein amino-terminal domain protein [Trifolium repens]|nr:EEIG1/EHBP1 protein amino-terminal domain protein [Trifolium repens]